VVHPLPTTPTFPAGQQRLELGPLLICQVMSIMHNPCLPRADPNHSRDTP